MGDIVPDAKITVIGEAPGENELNAKHPFVGRSGEILNSTLAEGGVAREDCTVTNAALCRPPEELKAFEYRLKIMHEAACARARAAGLPDPPEPITPCTCCAPRLKRDIEESNAKTVMAVGGAALRAVADHWNVPMGSVKKKVKAGELRIAGLKKQIGAPLTMKDGTIVVASYHPAFAMRPGSRHYMHVIKKHMTRTAEIAKRGKIDWVEPEYILEPDVETIERVLAEIQASGESVTIDIETDHGTGLGKEFDPFTCRIRCIGFGATINGTETVIVVPIRYMNGAEWWPDLQTKKRVIQACMNVLNSNPLVGHNLAFDTSVLLRFKMLVRRDREYDDSMLLHHDTPDNDLPHDLGFVGSRYFEVPSWKSGADDKYYEDITDYDLHAYNAKDVTVTMRLYPVLMDEIYKNGTVSQYELDRTLAPIARDMGELGLIIDERKRGELSLKMNEEAFSRLQKLKKIVKDEKFNPSSTPQIRRFLFFTKRHTPVINTKGKDWEDGEDPSTNTQALTKLMASQACDQDVKDFINTLLEYRAFMKLKGTYIDKLRVHYPNWKKEFGMDVEMLPEVKGPVFRKYNQAERIAIALKADPNALPVNKKGTKVLSDELRVAWKPVLKSDRKRYVDATPEGIWDEAVVIPARPAQSRLHTTYKIHVIPSGRLSTSPAVQNWPKFGKANMHEMIIAPPGHKMVGADLDQVELRLYAAIAGDKILIDAFTKPGPDGKAFDPHSLNAASLFSKKFGKGLIETYLYIVGMPDMYSSVFFKGATDQARKEGLPWASLELTKELTKELKDAFATRIKADEKAEQMAKAMDLPLKLVEAYLAGWKKGDKEKKKLRGYAKTFAYLETYGGEAEKLYGFMSTARDKGTGALMFPDLKEEDVLDWHEQWHKNHPETKAWQAACQRVARLEGYTATPIGSYRKRFYMGGLNKMGACFNHVIQGAAAEIANAALIKIARAIPYLKWSPFTGLCLQIHDYIAVYVPDEYAELAKKIIEEALNQIVFSIPITATAGISDGLATQ
jgi:DNA polymerase I-like protein with 3'-5' exonuclease and polymerase domains/uracil-DNA glycosylase